MENRSTNSIIFAVIIGMCLILGAVVASNWMPAPAGSASQDATQQNETEPTATASTNKTPNDYENWQEDLVTDRSTQAQVQTSDDSNPVPNDPDTTEAEPPRDLDSTLTGQFSVALARDILLREENLDDDELDARINGMVEDIVAETEDELYTIEDVSVVADSNEATETYFNAAGQAILDNDLEGVENELALFTRAIEDEDEQAYADIEQIATMYGNLSEAYLALSVPAEFSETHLDMINVFHKIHNSLRDMANASEDPVRAYIRFQRYPGTTESLLYTSISMGMYVQLHEGLFTDDDPARYFLTYLPDIIRNQ